MDIAACFFMRRPVRCIALQKFLLVSSIHRWYSKIVVITQISIYNMTIFMRNA